MDDSIDLFDGYSFKGRHSVLIDDDEDEEDDGSEEASEEEDEEDEELITGAVLEALEQTGASTEPPAVDEIVEEEIPDEPKTPEARPVSPPEPVPELLPAQPPNETAVTEPPQPADEQVPQPRKSKELPQPGPSETVPPTLPEKETKNKVAAPSKAHVPRPTGNRTARPRREKSGVHALDRYLSDAIDEDTEAAERDDDDEEDDDDWDFVEAADGEDRNGAKGNSLFARGVVDRYRLAVFRKASTPSQRPPVPRTFSGMSKSSQATVPDTTDSPSPTQKRGRTPLTFRKHPRQFLRPKSPPPSSFSSKSSGTAKSMTPSNSNTVSAASSSGGLLTPSPSFGAMSHSLKSKESAVSVGAQSSSDQSGIGESGMLEPLGVLDAVKGSPASEEPERHKNKKLKKYKENAEKVFSLFSSPRQPS
jgi:hypothetical protein